MIKIPIIRRYNNDQAVALLPLLQELYIKVYQSKGFVSAESLVNQLDPLEHLIISTWSSMEDWFAYNRSNEIVALRDSIDQVTGQQTTRSIYKLEN